MKARPEVAESHRWSDCLCTDVIVSLDSTGVCMFICACGHEHAFFINGMRNTPCTNGHICRQSSISYSPCEEHETATGYCIWHLWIKCAPTSSPSTYRITLRKFQYTSLICMSYNRVIYNKISKMASLLSVQIQFHLHQLTQTKHRNMLTKYTREIVQYPTGHEIHKSCLSTA